MVRSAFGVLEPMTNVTITWQQVRSEVQAAPWKNTALFVVVYVLIVGLWAAGPSDRVLHFEFARYWRYLGATVASGPVELLFIFCARMLFTSLWIQIILNFSQHQDLSFGCVRMILLAELVYLIPSWLYLVWMRGFQGDLNDLPVRSFEPIVLWNFNSEAFSSFSRAMDPALIDSYWLMYTAVIAFGLVRNLEVDRTRIVLSLIVGLLLGTVIWEMTWMLGPLMA